ncbi:MAG: membrane protein insertase YidC [Mariprofundaceae bacterium]|nr:membrane protein insertase YidC [Mariprofundaceae bacterium]
MEQRNMILAFVLSMIVLVSWEMMFPAPEENNTQTVTESAPVTARSGQAAPPPAESRSEQAAPPPVQSHPKQVENITLAPEAPANDVQEIASLKNHLLDLKIDSRGTIVVAQTMQYREELNPDSKPVSVLGTDGEHALYVNSGVIAQASPHFRVVSQKQNQGVSTLILRTSLTDGRSWTRTLTLQQDSYVLNVDDRIAHGTGLEMYRQVVEVNPSRETSRMYIYKGPIGLINDKLKEASFDDLDEASPVRYSAKAGWIGMMNRYFIAAIIGDKERKYRYYFKGDGRTYQAGRLEDAQVNGSDADFHSRIYIGPKSTPVMKTLNAGLERSVDYGWFAVIAKPLHDLLLLFHGMISNFGLCIILLVVLIKILFYWPTKKSYESMAAMRKLQPEMKRLKGLYGDDRQRMGQEMMLLYKKHKVNPLGGCLPMVIQIPVFFALYKTLLVSIEMRHAPFFGWIHDLSVMDPYYVLPVLMGASMLVQQQLNPTPPDPIQAKIMKFLPVIFTFMFLFFPSGLVVYWLVNNILAITQQWYVMRKMKAI